VIISYHIVSRLLYTTRTVFITNKQVHYGVVYFLIANRMDSLLNMWQRDVYSMCSWCFDFFVTVSSVNLRNYVWCEFFAVQWWCGSVVDG